MSQTLSDGFCNTFHIGKVKRGPLRKDLSKLRSRANKLVPGTEQTAILNEINRAYTIIDGGPKTNANRRKTVEETQKLVVEIDKTLTSIVEKTPEKVIGFKKPVVETKDDKRRKDELLKTIATVLNEIEAMFTPQEGQPNVVYLDDVSELSRFGLNGEAEFIRLEINASAVTEDVKVSIETKIETLRGTMKESANYAESVRSLVATHEALVEDGRRLVRELAKTMGDKAQKSPLALKTEALHAALHPERGALNGNGIVDLVGELDDEIKAIQEEGNLVAYGQGATTKVDTQDKIDREIAAFDQKVGGPLEALRLATQPVDGASYREQQSLMLDERAKILTQTPPNLDASGLADAVVNQVNAALLKAQQDADAMKLRAENLIGTIQPELDKIADTRDMTVFALDWKQIEGLKTSITKLMPGSAPLTGQTLANLAAAEPLVTALLASAAAILQDKPAVLDFDTKLAGLKKNLKEAAKSKDPMTKYYASDLKKLQEDFDKFEKALPKTKAKAASESLDKQIKAFADKRKAADELGTYITDDIEPARQNAWNIYTEAQFAGYEPKIPNTQQMTLNAFHEELKKQPPDKAKLATMLTALNKAYEDIDSIQDLLDKTAETHETEKKAKADQKQKDRDIKTPLRDRYQGLKRQLEAAEEEVGEVKGDMNPIKRLKMLLKDASAQIEAVDEKKATAVMDRVQAQIDMVLANPKGEAASKRKELPALYTSYNRIRTTASKNLKAVGEMVETYAESGDDEIQKKAKKLGRRIEAYRKRFAVGHGQLRHLITTLSDDNEPEQKRRDAREAALAAIADLQRGLATHKLSKLLATSKIRTAVVVPRRLLAGMDRLYFTILTSVE